LATDRRTVIVTTALERASLGAARALADRGHRVVHVGVTAPVGGLWTRSAAAHELAPDPLLDPAGFATAIAEIAAGQEADVVLPGCDASLHALSDHRDRLDGVVEHGLPRRDAVRRSLDKLGLEEASRTAGLLPPESELCTDVSSAFAAVERLGLPVVVKPRFSVIAREGRLQQQGSGIARTDAELRAQVRRLGPQVLVQPRLVGATCSFGGVATSDGLLGSCFARYRRTWPAPAGNASCAQTEPVPPRLLETVRALLDALEWRGVFELELVQEEDGRLRPIDFNPRIYGSVTLAAAAGANLPSLWCEHLSGDRPIAEVASVGQRYRWEDGDVRHVGRYLREGRPAEAARVLLPRRATAHAYFRRDDPGPFLARLAALGGVAVRRLRSGRVGPDGRPTVSTTGWRGGVQVAMLRAAARTEHTYRAGTTMARVLGDDQIATVDFQDGGRLTVRLGDAYWSRLLVGWECEPDAVAIIDGAIARQPKAVLLDCGANIGYFSSRSASRVRTVAVEAVPSVFAQLQENAAVNGFHAIHAAVWSRSGEMMTVTSDGLIPAAASVVRDLGEVAAEVPTTTITELYERYVGDGPAIVKLGVEGAEIAALEGAASVLDRCLVVYEDHGEDRDHDLTRHLLERGFVVYHHDGIDSVPIRAPVQLDGIETDTHRAHSFFAADPNSEWAETWSA
jgi:FkbM family methyltransferase